MEHVFHQMERYVRAFEFIHAINQNTSYSILEVGSGSHAILAELLPDADITFVDISLDDKVKADSRFIEADFFELKMVGNSFDYVVSLDTLEHIAPEKREQFIEKLYFIAKNAVILIFPHEIKERINNDDLLADLYKLASLEAPEWTREHILYPLPRVEDVVSIISKYTCQDNILLYYSVYNILQKQMLDLELIASTFPEYGMFFQLFNNYYINECVKLDCNIDKKSAVKANFLILKNTELHALFNKNYMITQNNMDVLNKTVELLRRQVDLCFSLVFQKNLYYCSGNIGLMEKKLSIMQREMNNIEEQLLFLKDTKENEPIKLNVILITYNQSHYIEETLQSILNQKTNFKFNIIVADDCSSDDTLEKIKAIEYTTEIPFLYLDNSINHGIMKNYQRAFQNCNADYVAIMEGDDLWIDSYRLQKHVDFLNEHFECAMSFNRFLVKNFEDGTSDLRPHFGAAEEMLYYKYVSGHDLAYDNLIGNFSTSVYRTKFLKNLPEQLYDMKAYDWLTNILISTMGYIGCLMEPMSIYRIHSKGVWSSKKEQEKLQDIIDQIDEYNNFTEYKFSDGFVAHKNRLEDRINSLNIVEKIAIPIPNKNKKNMIKTVLRKIVNLTENYMPPIIIQCIKLFIPRIIQRKLEEKGII